jgi:hypothetical protein
VSGQSFLELLQWDPRDVDTMIEHYEDQASEQRMEQARQALKGG